MMRFPLLSRLVNGVLGRFGYALVRIDGASRPPPEPAPDAQYLYDNPQLVGVYAPWLTDRPFLQVWRKARSHTLTDIFRCHELWTCVREVAKVPGDIVEVGVWRGGSGAVLAASAKAFKPDARVWLCDTFTGVVKAGHADPSYRGGEHADTSAGIVTTLLADLQLDNATVLRGIFPDQTAAPIGERAIALCHIDVDVYQSAADIVAWVTPRLSRGAMLVFDDYGFATCQGITRLVDELRTSGDWLYFYNLNKHAILVRR